MSEVLYGYCQCGCGEKTELCPQTINKIGWKKGEPKHYIHGHQSRKPVVEYIVDEDGCWIWQRYKTKKGYGLMRPYGSSTMRGAHIVYYERAKGTVPEGMQVGHLCHDNDPSCPGGVCKHRLCVNPDHLMPQTNTENQRGGRKPKLSVEAVREIRATPKTYGSTTALAHKFGVHPNTISSVRNGRGWSL